MFTRNYYGFVVRKRHNVNDIAQLNQINADFLFIVNVYPGFRQGHVCHYTGTSANRKILFRRSERLGLFLVIVHIMFRTRRFNQYNL